MDDLYLHECAARTQLSVLAQLEIAHQVERLRLSVRTKQDKIHEGDRPARVQVAAYQLDHAREWDLKPENAGQGAEEQCPEKRERDGDKETPPGQSRPKCVGAPDTRGNRGYEDEQIPPARHLVVRKHQPVVRIRLLVLGSAFLKERARVPEEADEGLEVEGVAQCVAVEQRDVGDRSGDAEVSGEKVARVRSGKEGEPYLLQLALVKLEGRAEDGL